MQIVNSAEEDFQAAEKKRVADAARQAWSGFGCGGSDAFGGAAARDGARW